MWKGGPVGELLETLDSKEDIVFLGYVSNELLPKIVASAFALTYVSLFEGSEMPFNQFGYYRNDVQYNYTGVTDSKTESSKFFLEDVNISRFDKVLENEVRKFNPNVYSTLIDFEISKVRNPRQ